MSKNIVKKNVEKLLNEYFVLRNNDKLLVWVYWYMIDGVVNDGDAYDLFGQCIGKAEFERATSPARIIRVRALIQNVEDNYLPTDKEARKARKISDEKWRIYVRNHQDQVNDSLRESVMGVRG